MTAIKSLCLVFVGGGLGSVARHAIGLALSGWATRFPYATLTANVLACLLLGALTVWMRPTQEGTGYMDSYGYLLLATGFCGGFSTFSTFTLETASLIREGHLLSGAANIIGNFILCLLALLVGISAAKSMAA